MKVATYHIFFSNLANPLRIEIISALMRGKKSVGELEKEVKEEQSKLSHALASLRKCNLVNSERKGKVKIYSLNKRTLMPILKIIDNHAIEDCGNDCKQCKICKMEVRVK